MRLRWSLFARMTAIVALALFALQLLLVWLYVTNRGPGAEPGYRFPLPERIVAMARALDASGDRAGLLAALNGPDVVVTIEADSIAAFAEEEIRLPRVEALLARYEAALGDRRFAAFIAVPDGVPEGEIRLGDRSVWSRYPLRIAVELESGGTLLVESRDDLVTRIYSIPIGFYSGVAALVSALIVLLVLRRETAPLRELADAARKFGEGGVPTTLRERGASELRDLIAAFNQMQGRVEELIRARSLMLGALGHDLRTYLTRLRLRADLLPVDQRRPIEADIERMSIVLESCLELARDAGEQDRRERIDLRGWLDAYVARRRDAGDAVSFNNSAPDPVAIEAEAAALERVLDNLVDNALKFGTRCTVGLARAGAGCEIAVRDNGPGIPASDRETVFRPFHRAGAARTLGREGSGLGLAIAKALTERNGGQIRLGEDQPGGATVIVSLPVAA